MGGAGNLPAPVGTLHTGTATDAVMEPALALAINAAPVPSGKLPHGTG